MMRLTAIINISVLHDADGPAAWALLLQQLEVSALWANGHQKEGQS
jgi:hypothetical protein